MKNTFVLIMFFASVSAFSQTYNPASMEANQQTQMVQVYGGLKYGTIWGAGYFRSFAIKNHPVWAGARFETPSGKDLFDDHLEEISLTTTVFQKGSYRINTGIGLIHRVTQNPYVNMQNLGGELEITTGIYRPKWHLAAEAVFDQSLSTRLTHQPAYREIYPEVQDGWYKGNGGNMRIGLQGGYEFEHLGINMKMGPSISSTGRPNLLFFYSVIGVNWRW